MWLIKDMVWLDEHDPVLLPFEEEQLGEYLDSLLKKIASCNGACDAVYLLYELGDFQGALYKAYFKYDAILPPRCVNLIRQIDRWDLSEIRHEVFNQIKNRQFCIGHDVLDFKEEVSFIDEVTALYVCDERKAQIQMKKYPDCVILDADTIKSWLPPYDEKYLSDWKKKLIQKRVSSYFDKKGIAYGWI